MRNSITNKMPPKRQVKKNTEPKSCAKSDGSGEDEEAALERFTLELHWCVDQLEVAIQKKKGSAKHNEELMRSHKTLTSGKAPLVKKRQVMSALFGDYRSKMAQEERKIKIEPPKIKTNSIAPRKSKFLKQSVTSNAQPSPAFATDNQPQLQDRYTNSETDSIENASNEASDSTLTQELESRMASCLSLQTDMGNVNTNASDSVQQQDPETRMLEVSGGKVETSAGSYKFISSGNSFRFNFYNPS